MKETSVSRFWPLVQRLVTFDDPTAKWSSVQKIVKRMNPDELVAQNQPYQEALSLFLKREAELFTKVALDSWCIHARKSVPTMSGQSASEWVRAFTIPESFWVSLTQEQQTVDERLLFFQALADGLLHPADSKLAFFERTFDRFRPRLPGSFLPNAIVLVEGQTESTLLPTVCQAFDLNLNQKGVMVISAGGANQVLRRYLNSKETFSIPIFCLFDRDATEQSEMVDQNLRDRDRMHVLTDGEFENLIQPSALAPMLNDFILTLPTVPNDALHINPGHLSVDANQSKNLDKLWRERSLGKFDKVGFAEHIRDKVSSKECFSSDAHLLVEKLSEMIAT